MKKPWFLLIVLLACASFAGAQRIEIAPYPDAVPISIDGLGQMYLSNADALTLREHFIGEFAPDKIISVEDNYFSGYRLCFNSGSCHPEAESADWIQILTIDEEAALDWFGKNTPEVLTLPFEGLKKCIGKNGHTTADYNKTVEEYRSISGKIYPQTVAPNGMQTDELTASVQRTELRLKNNSESQYVSLNSGGMSSSEIDPLQKQTIDPWVEWIKCLDEIKAKSYTTLIEFNEPAITPF